MPPIIIMSPITFKQQVDQLVSELSRCIKLCHDIREYRNIGSRHENLDLLQSTLKSAEGSINTAYRTTRSLVGSQLEIGDGKSPTLISSQNAWSNEKQKYQEPRWTDISSTCRQGSSPSSNRLPIHPNGGTDMNRSTPASETCSTNGSPSTSHSLKR